MKRKPKGVGDEHRGLMQIYLGALLLFVILSIAVIGYRLAGWDILDSIYMVVITIFGVGYSEVHPLDSPELKVFTIFVIIAGTSAAIYIVGGFFRMVTEGEINRMVGSMKKQKSVEKLRDHVIICGYGRIGRSLARQLSQTAIDFLVLDKSEDRISDAEEAGYLALQGNAIEEEDLMKAGIEHASVLATVLPDDTLNVFITLTARNICPSIRIIARAENPMTEKKLRQAGADEVVMPTVVSGIQIANSISRPALDQFMGDVKSKRLANENLRHLGLGIVELKVHHETWLKGMTVGEFRASAGCGFILLAIRHGDDGVEENPGNATVFDTPDSLILVSQGSDVKTMIELMRQKHELDGNLETADA